MNALFFQISTNRKNHKTKMAKTLETNMTSDKGDEKSQNITNLIILNNNTTKKDKNWLYLLQYQKYFSKKLVIKYNILPNEYNLMKLDNFIAAKYCHSLAVFKEMLIYNYDEEFLKRFYSRKDALKKIPLFSEFYKSYLKFFCFPTLSELKLNELIEDMVENKAKAFYNENYSKEKDKEKTDKKINVVIFTNKIRKDISRRNSLTNLTKTTIKNKSITNKSSRSIVTIEKIYNELNCNKINKNINLNSRSEDKFIKPNNLGNNKNIQNSGKKNIENNDNRNMVIFKKIDCNYKLGTLNNLGKNNILYNKFIQSSNNSKNKIKNKISRNIQNKLLDNKASTIVNDKKTNEKVSTLKTLPKYNTKLNTFKNIISQYNLTYKKISLDNKNKIVNLSNKPSQKGEIKNINSNIKTNNKIKHKPNNNKIINNNSLKLKNNKNCLTNVRLPQNNTDILNNNTTNFKNIPKKAIQVTKKPQIKKVKSRNYKSINGINTANDIKGRIQINENNFNYYFTTNDKNLNSLSKKMQSSKKKTKKIIKTDKKPANAVEKVINTKNINTKIFNHLNNIKRNVNNSENSDRKKNKTSLSPSLKNLILKTKGISNCRNNKMKISKTNANTNVNSYMSSDSQRLVKNLKIVNSG